VRPAGISVFKDGIFFPFFEAEFGYNKFPSRNFDLYEVSIPIGFFIRPSDYKKCSIGLRIPAYRQAG